jgi:serine/threonine protein kinase
MHSLGIVHRNVKVVRPSPSPAPHCSVLTPSKRNVLIDGNGVARLGGLGAAFPPSLPDSWSDVGSGRLFCGIAPELIDLPAFGFVHSRATKATDMFSFGMLAWEVGQIFLCLKLDVFTRLRPSSRWP